MDLNRKAKFALGPISNFDPCDECLLKPVCTEECVKKFRYEGNRRVEHEIVRLKSVKKNRRKFNALR